MRASTFAIATCFVLATIRTPDVARAGDADQSSPAPVVKPSPSERVEWRSTVLTEYTASADFSNSKLGSQDAVHSTFQIDSAVPVGRGFYVDAGVFYERYGFGTSLAPVPTTLHAVGANTALEWRFEGETAALLQLSPGFYGSELGASGDFNIPVTFGFAFKLSRSFVGGVGFYYDQFRQYQVNPLIGFRWTINKEWKVMSRLPDLDVIYTHEDWEFDAGLRAPGAGFKNATNEKNYPGRRIDYIELRARAGVRYNGFKPFSLYVNAGWSFVRRIRFDEFDEEYRTDGAPFVSFEASSEL